MTVTQAPNVTDKVTNQTIRRTANALVDDGVFPRSDLEDVEQELRLALVEQAPNFNPDKARWSTFVRHVVKMAAISLRRHQKAQRRQGCREVPSLNVLLKDPREMGPPTELGATVSEEEFRTGVGQDFISHTEQIDLSLDVESVLDSLPEGLRDICERLKYQTPTEVRRELGISRTTMNRRLEALREHFRKTGIGECA